MNHDPRSLPLTIDDLLQEEQWLAGFVRHLVDPADADDVIQETWLAALRNPPRHRAAVRTWLSTVARNFARQLGRRRRRRRDGETMAARSEAIPSAEATVDRLATVAVLVQAVMALEDPYRNAVLLRYYHRLPIREVALRSGVPEPTARQHVKRGLDQVRRGLRQRYGNEWRGAVQVLMLGGAQSLPVATPVSSLTIGVTMMSKKFLFGSVAVLALGGLVFTLFEGDTNTAGGAVTAAEDRSLAADTNASTASPVDTERAERTELASAPTEGAGATNGVVWWSARKARP